MSAARAVQGLVAGVVEAAFAGVDLGLTIRLGASGRMANRDPLGIGFEPALHSCCLLASSPASALAAGRAALWFDYRATFSARPSHPIWRAVRRCLSMRERSGRQVVPERSGPSGLARRACMVSTADAPARS